ncbi:MAG: LysM peptidoglycan-binding domain-containing protein, partial [Enterocloster sp.]
VYTVGEGETLYGICFKVYQNVNKLDEICRINELRDQNSIYAGQKLLMP